MKSLAAAALASSVLIAGCAAPQRPVFESTTPQDGSASRSPSETVSPTSTLESEVTEAIDDTTALLNRLERLCNVGNPKVAGSLENGEIVEASGMVRATTHDGFWVLNDGDDARIFAVGPAGENRGSIPIAGVQLWDLEDMARWDENGRTQIVLADIGDNGSNRSPSHPLVIVEEPEVGAVSADARVVFIVYPDGAHNAEALLIDTETNEVVVITKEESAGGGELLPAQVFAGSLDGAETDGIEIQLRFVGFIDIAALREKSSDTKFHPGELRGLSALVTAADISPDGRLIAMRTYGSVWAWARRSGTSVAETLITPPCEAEPPFELQGEAIAFVDNTRWATLAEGSFVSLRLSPA